MACNGLFGDYSCQGWVTIRTRIRERDDQRCRGCNRGEADVRLEVHHRVYGNPGVCGACVLTGVADEDLVTLCVDCHDGVTDVRRRVRYGGQAVEVTLLTPPAAIRTTIMIETSVSADPIGEPVKRGVVVQRYQTDI